MYINNSTSFIQNLKPYEEIIPALISEAEEVKLNQKDYKANGIIFTEDDSLSFRCGTENYKMDVTEFALSQYCNKIGMPNNFFKKLRTSKEPALIEMARKNINTLAGFGPDNIMFRCNKNIVRGVLTDKYTPFDTVEILKAFNNELNYSNEMTPADFKVAGYAHDPDMLHLRMIYGDPIKGEGIEHGIYAGMTINTSNIGVGKISVNFMLYRQVCSNGMIISHFNQNLFSQRHINISVPEIAAGLSYTFGIFPQIAAQIQDKLTKASTTKISNELLNLQEKGYRMETVKNKLGVSDKDMEEIIILLNEKYPKTVWGFTNAVTEFSKTKSLERRLELERLAGDLFYTPDKYALVA